MSMLKNAVCTLVTNNYIADGIVCSNYLSLSNPEIKYYLFTIGKLKVENIKLLSKYKNIIHVPVENFINNKILENLILSYSPFEISNALRGTCHKYIYENTDIDQWLMIDADIAVVGPLSEIFEFFVDSEIFITSHGSKPHQTREAIISNELSFLKHGIFNSGMIGFKRGENSYQAILWYENRLLSFSEFSRNRINAGIKNTYDFLFVDQLWINLLPIYFKKTKISFESRFNLGHWNLWEGKLTFSATKNYFFDNKKVIAFHFSGISRNKPEYVSIHNIIYIKNPNFIWAKAANEYIKNIGLVKGKVVKDSYFYKNRMPKYSKRLLFIRYLTSLLRRIFLIKNFE